MNDLWNKWRGDLHRKFVKPSKTIQEALKHTPEGVDRGDWEWLVKEHFSSEKFLVCLNLFCVYICFYILHLILSFSYILLLKLTLLFLFSFVIKKYRQQVNGTQTIGQN